MKNKNDKQINFLNPKIGGNFKVKRKALIKYSIYIYIMIAILYIGNITIKNINLNNQIKEIESQISDLKQIEQNEEIEKDLQKYEELNSITSAFLEKDKYAICSDILEKIEMVRPKSINIKQIVWKENKISLKCESIADIDSMNFIKTLRENEKFKDILYLGGGYSKDGEVFSFEVTINL